jgi:hypothetical protein
MAPSGDRIDWLSVTWLTSIGIAAICAVRPLCIAAAEQQIRKTVRRPLPSARCSLRRS